MSQLHHVILRPVLTEQSTQQADAYNKVTFKVAVRATKYQIRAAVETLFGVKVERVNTQVVPGKPKRVGRRVHRRPGYKKAVVTLAEGSVIDFFAMEGEALEGEEDEDEFGPEDFADAPADANQ